MIPLIDLDRWFEGNEAQRAALAVEVDDHLRRLGFLVVINHRLPAEVIASTREACREFLISCGVQPRAGGAQHPVEPNMEELFPQMPIAALASLFVISPHALHHQLFTFVYFAAPLCISTFVFLQWYVLQHSLCFTVTAR